MKMKEGRKNAWAMAFVTAMALLSMTSAAKAAGLRTQFGEVVVRNIKIGQTYSLDKLINLPMRILNTGERTADLEIKLVSMSSSSLRSGYESLPDFSWVKIEKTNFQVPPNHEAVTDIIISIPNDPKFLGRRFEADIWSRDKARGNMFSVAMMSRLLLEISSIPPTEDELKKKFVNRRLANLDFTLFPSEGLAKDVPIGKPFDLKKERKISLKLVNPNDRALHFKIRSLGNWESLIPTPNGYDGNINPQWLKPETDLIKIGANSIQDIGLSISLPKDDRYYERKLFFVVSVEVLEQEISAQIYYKLLVDTEANPKASKGK